MTPSRISKWFRVRLSTFVILCTALPAVFGGWIVPSERQRAFVHKVKARGGAVVYRNGWTSFLGCCMPRDYVDSVDAVALCSLVDYDAELSQLDLVHSIRSLDLSSNDSDARSGARISAVGLRRVSRLYALESLDLSGLSISDADLSKFDKLTLLKSLRLRRSLQGESIGDEGVAILARLPLAKTLEHLDLEATRITNRALDDISKMDRLRELRLKFTNIGDEGLAVLCEKGKLPLLTTLSLQGTKVTDAGVSGLENLPSLRCLDLGLCDVGGASVEALLKLNSLTYLRLVSTDLTDRDIAKLGELRNLRYLDISCRYVSDIGGISQLPQLETLSLCDTRVTPSKLSRAKWSDSLRVLEINDVAANRELEDLLALSKQIPEARIRTNLEIGVLGWCDASDIERYVKSKPSHE